MRISKLADHIGAEVTGIDLRRPVDDATRRRINAAAVAHLVLVVRDQTLSPDHFLAAARLFGEPMEQHTAPFALPHQTLVHEISSLALDAAGRPLKFGGRWHTDHSDHEVPPKHTMLHAIELPDSGGGTGFVDMRASYRALPDAYKQRIASLRTATPLFGAARSREDPSFAASAIHPLVRTIPDDGAKALYFHPNKTSHIIGMTPEATQALLDDLMAHSLRPEFMYTHNWRRGDMLVWDNRALLHKANFDFDPAQPRRLYRVMVKGERPQ